MDDMLRSEIVGNAGLTIAACVALVLTVWRRPQLSTPDAWERTGVIFGLALLVDIAHFAEEFATGFYLRYPPVLGLVPWSSRFYLSFNAFWLTVWVCCIYGLSRASRLALFPAWFFALAAIANGAAQIVLAAREGSYFPGLLTAPLVCLAGVWVFRRLAAMTRRPDATALAAERGAA